MFSRVLCFLAICLLQVYAYDVDVDENWPYCQCLANVSEAKARYEAKNAKYLNDVKETREKWEAAIKDRVDQIREKQGCKNPYFNKNVREFTWEMLAICGGYAIGDRFDPPWKTNKTITDEDSCVAYATMGPIMSKYIDLDHKVLANCDVSKTFDKNIWPTYEKCISQCKI